MSFNNPIWWARDAVGILRQSGCTDHADAVLAVCERQAQLEAELAEARKDSERLDWLEAHPRIIVAATGYRGAKDSWYWRDETDALATHETATLRAAIDSARGTK